jgi:hypothetical protein
LAVCLSIYLSTHHLSSIHPSIHPSIIHPQSTCFYVHAFTSVCLSIYLSSQLVFKFGKVIFREVKYLVQGHTMTLWWSLVHCPVLSSHYLLSRIMEGMGSWSRTLHTAQHQDHRLCWHHHLPIPTPSWPLPLQRRQAPQRRQKWEKEVPFWFWDLKGQGSRDAGTYLLCEQTLLYFSPKLFCLEQSDGLSNHLGRTGVTSVLGMAITHSDTLPFTDTHTHTNSP